MVLLLWRDMSPAWTNLWSAKHQKITSFSDLVEPVWMNHWLVNHRMMSGYNWRRSFCLTSTWRPTILYGRVFFMFPRATFKWILLRLCCMCIYITPFIYYLLSCNLRSTWATSQQKEQVSHVFAIVCIWFWKRFLLILINLIFDWHFFVCNKKGKSTVTHKNNVP